MPEPKADLVCLNVIALTLETTGKTTSAKVIRDAIAEIKASRAATGPGSDPMLDEWRRWLAKGHSIDL